MKLIDRPDNGGSVFLKANQSSGEIRIRLEEGLGEGILISSQHSSQEKELFTWGPFPLNFFACK